MINPLFESKTWVTWKKQNKTKQNKKKTVLAFLGGSNKAISITQATLT